MVHGKVALRQLKEGDEIAFKLFSDYEDRSRLRPLKSVVRISSWRGVEEPQEAIGAVVSVSDGKDTEERTGHQNGTQDE